MKCAFCGAECMDTVCDACARGEVWAGSLTLDRVHDELYLVDPGTMDAAADSAMGLDAPVRVGRKKRPLRKKGGLFE